MNCPGYPNRTVYIEYKPEYYVGPLSVTICCKPSEKQEALALALELGADMKDEAT